ncbi:MAG TPA: DUF1697 domain-containing protein [Spirochaetia bacterium]|nr:DUF1697 domain-containing protein [Spirochaetia bacterium]
MKNAHVALVRGINVGPNKRVNMADLRALVEELGYSDVRTLLNSGNVVFSSSPAKSKDAASRIEKALEQKVGVSARVVVMSADELAAAVEENPLATIADNASRLLLGVMADPTDKKKLSDITRQDWGQERIALGASRAVYMWMPKGVIESKLNAAVSKALGEGVTTRNWATILKLRDMTGAP